MAMFLWNPYYPIYISVGLDLVYVGVCSLKKIIIEKISRILVPIDKFRNSEFRKMLKHKKKYFCTKKKGKDNENHLENLKNNDFFCPYGTSDNFSSFWFD